MGGLVRPIRKHNKTFWPLPRKTKKGMTLLNAFKNWLLPSHSTRLPPPTPPQKKYVGKNKNTKRELRLLSVWTSLHHYIYIYIYIYIELLLFIPSDILFSLSCAGTIINRQGIYHKRFFGFRKRRIILESSGICRTGRGANAKNAWKVTNDGSRKDRWHAGSFYLFFLYQKNWEFGFHSQSKEYWSKIKRW